MWVVSDINANGAETVANQVLQKGARSVHVHTDVTARTQVDSLIHQAIEAFGQVHFLFNSAGAAGRRSEFLDIDEDLMRKTFDLNVYGTFYTMQAVLPHMLHNKEG